MKSRVTVLVTVFIMLLSAGIASANDDIDPRVDTLFTYGYDPEAQLFFTSTHPMDTSLHDCTVNGEYSAGYGETSDEGETPVVGLTEANGETVEFGPGKQELAEGLEAPTTSITYSADGPCAISGRWVGANGHVNHGQLLKLWNSTVDMQGRGCLNRYIAQSRFGKDDQQVKHDEAADDQVTDEATAPEGGTITFATAKADCEHGNKDKAEHHGAKERDQKNDRPEKPGKSDKAPGHNK